MKCYTEPCNANQINGDNLNKIRHETGRTFRKKGLSETKFIRELNRGINEFKKVTHLEVNS
jgi:hypothetical protein